MKKTIVLLSLFAFAMTFTAEAQTQRTRTATAVLNSWTVKDTMTNADTLNYIVNLGARSCDVVFHLQHNNISGTLRDTVRVYSAAPATSKSIRTGAYGAGYYHKEAEFLIGATGLIGGYNDTAFTLSLKRPGNLKVVHKTTGTQSTGVELSIMVKPN
jgi:hypothetical protein